MNERDADQLGSDNTTPLAFSMASPAMSAASDAADGVIFCLPPLVAGLGGYAVMMGAVPPEYTIVAWIVIAAVTALASYPLARKLT